MLSIYKKKLYFRHFKTSFILRYSSGGGDGDCGSLPPDPGSYCTFPGQAAKQFTSTVAFSFARNC